MTDSFDIDGLYLYQKLVIAQNFFKSKSMKKVSHFPNLGLESFQKQNLRGVYENVSSRLNKLSELRENFDLFLASVILNNKGDYPIVDLQQGWEDHLECFRRHRKARLNLVSSFKKDLSPLFLSYEVDSTPFPKLFEYKKTSEFGFDEYQLPFVIRKYLGGVFEAETLLILDKICPYLQNTSECKVSMISQPSAKLKRFGEFAPPLDPFCINDCQRYYIERVRDLWQIDGDICC